MSLDPYQSGNAKLCNRIKNLTFSGANRIAGGEKILYFLVQTVRCQLCQHPGALWLSSIYGTSRPRREPGRTIMKVFLFLGVSRHFQKKFHKEYGIFLNGEGNEFGKLFFLGAMVPLGH